MTAGRRRKARRNVVIAAAARQGCSQRLIAEAFGLPRSLVAEIIAATDPARRRPAPEPEDD
jgi:transposase